MSMKQPGRFKIVFCERSMIPSKPIICGLQINEGFVAYFGFARTHKSALRAAARRLRSLARECDRIAERSE
jgi:hypothetical protein